MARSAKIPTVAIRNVSHWSARSRSTSCERSTKKPVTSAVRRSAAGGTSAAAIRRTWSMIDRFTAAGCRSCARSMIRSQVLPSWGSRPTSDRTKAGCWSLS
jgi:hypothetical protein